MPKTVDTAARRREIGDAVLRLVVRHGLDGVSVRSVATEAGCSAGAVQAYFPTKRELIGYAYELAGDEALRRFAAVDPTGAVRTVLRRLILAYLPLDEDRRRHAAVWANFAVFAAHDPDTATAAREVDNVIRAAMADLVREAQRAGEAPRELAPEWIADALLAVADGLNLRLLYGAPPQPAIQALDVALNAFFSDP